MNVRYLPRDDDTCGWIRTLPPRRAPVRLAGDVSADWAIVGAGFTGVAAARRIAELEPNAKVVLVDAQRAGESASGRNSGFAVDFSTSRAGTTPRDDEAYLRKRRLNVAAIECLRALVAEHGIECQWSEVGKFHCAADERNVPELDAIAAACRRLDLPFEELDARALRARLGTAYWKRGVHTPGSVMLQPAALVRGLALSLPESVALYEESPVERIEYGATIRLECRGGTVRAQRLVLAANGFLPSLGVLRDRLVPMTLTASLTRRLNDREHEAIGSPDDWGALAAHGLGATVRYTQDHRVLMRNTWEMRSPLHMTPEELAVRRRVHEHGIRVRFPDVRDFTIEHTWSGVVCMSRNLMPYFGRLRENVWASGGYNGSGVTRGSIAGRLIAEYALGGQSDLLRDALDTPGPAWVPPRPFLDLGVRWSMARMRRGSEREI